MAEEAIAPLERKWMPKLTAAQRKMVLRGGYDGEQRMDTVQALKRLGLFYLDIDSPNGRCGIMRLTTYGRRVQAALREATQPAEQPA